MSSFHSRPMAGRSLGKYELLHRLGIGGMGEVFVARESGVAGVKRLVAVKVMLPELAEDPGKVDSFIDEARIAALLSHPNIVQTYDFGEDDGVYYLAMEYVAGANLARLCERAARRGVDYSRNVAIHVVAEMARGLHVAHSAVDAHGKPLNIVHRDISPHNVLVSRHGDVKLMDFGVARASVRRQRTQTGELRGKFAYMSPEQIGIGKLDPRSDVFSAGIVLWETTLMKRLFAGVSDVDTIRRVGEAEIPRPGAIDPTYPPKLETVVMHALARDPEERFQTAAALSTALRNVLAEHDRVEKSELATMVCTLFPETDPAMLDLEAAPRMTAPVIATPSAPVPEGDPTVADDAATEEDPPTVEDTPRAGRWPLWAAVVSVCAVGVIIAVVVLAGGGGGDGEAAVVVDAGHDATAALASEMSPIDAGAADPIVVATAPIDASTAAVATRRGDDDDGDRRRARDRAKVDAAVAAAVVPPGDDPKPDDPIEQPPPPARGRIAVASNPYGKVTIDGKGYGYTDLLEKLPPGTYSVQVALSDGSGTYSATARIEPDKKTKCQVRKKRLSCGSPR